MSDGAIIDLEEDLKNGASGREHTSQPQDNQKDPFFEEFNQIWEIISSKKMANTVPKARIETLINSFFDKYFSEYSIRIDAGEIFGHLLWMGHECGFTDKELKEYNALFFSKAKQCISLIASHSPERHSTFFWNTMYPYLYLRKRFYSDPRFEVKLFKDTLNDELQFQYDFFVTHRNAFLKTENYPTNFFYTWIDFCIFAYQNCDKNFLFHQFINDIIVLGISISKNNCDFDTFSSCVIIREQFKTEHETNIFKKIIRKLNGFLTGYGERPGRLLVCFVVMAIVFTGLYYFVPGFEGLPLGAVDRLVSSLYFFITTSLTIGYGEIHAISGYNIAITIVLINEILGFTIGGAFISLLLRKLFRY